MDIEGNLIGYQPNLVEYQPEASFGSETSFWMRV